MGRVNKYSKKTSPLRLKKTVCVILPRVDVNEFLRERRRRSLSQGPSPSNNASSSVNLVSSTTVRNKRSRLPVKKEPPCIFHSQIDIVDDNNFEEIPGVLSEPIQNESFCLHDVTRSMCYMCSPHPEDKSQIWNEIDYNKYPSTNVSQRPIWHVPTIASNNTASSNTSAPTPNTESSRVFNNDQSPNASNQRVDTFMRDLTAVLDRTDISVGTGDDFPTPQSTDCSTQTLRHFTCKHCTAMFTDVAHLIHHKTVHQRMLECPFCAAHFITKNDLKGHMKVHMPPKYYDCVYCPQAFTKKHDIREHLRLHAEQKQFHCNLCPARFNQRINLRNHEQSHNVSKFIHVFKKIDDTEPLDANSSTSTVKSAKRVSLDSSFKEKSEITRNSAASEKAQIIPGPSKSSKRGIFSHHKQLGRISTVPTSKANGCSTVSNRKQMNEFTPEKTMQSVSCGTDINSKIARPSYLTLASISNTSYSSNLERPSGSTNVYRSASTVTETLALSDVQPEEISTKKNNFFKCRDCPLSFKHFRGLQTHRICHTRKNGKFVCEYCQGKFMKKIGLVLHKKFSHSVV